MNDTHRADIGDAVKAWAAAAQARRRAADRSIVPFLFKSVVASVVSKLAGWAVFGPALGGGPKRNCCNGTEIRLASWPGQNQPAALMIQDIM